MHVGAINFFTDYTMTPPDLAQALEARGFDSLWTAEHSHIPASRRSPYPGGGDLPREYYATLDPFVTLTAAAAATKTLKVGTGVCLLNQRDPIQTAKLVASLDLLSNGRFLFGVGIGWNAEEMENHGTVFASRAKLVRERIEAMKEIWTKPEAEYHGEFVNFDPIIAWPKPVQKPNPPIIVGGAFPHAARRAVRYGDGWMPLVGPTGGDGDPFVVVPKVREMLKEAGRDPAAFSFELIIFSPDLDTLKRYQELGIARVIAFLPTGDGSVALPALDQWAEAIGKL